MKIIVVLGNKLNHDSMTTILKGRLNKALTIVGKNDIIIVTGGKTDPYSYHSEAYHMKRYLQHQGINNLIITESRAKDTIDNIRLTRLLVRNLPPSNIVVVTSKSHTARVEKILFENKLNWKVIF